MQKYSYRLPKVIFRVYVSRYVLCIKNRVFCILLLFVGSLDNTILKIVNLKITLKVSDNKEFFAVGTGQW